MSGLDRALAWARTIQHEVVGEEYPDTPTTAAIMAKHLLAEHERAERVTAERELYRNHGIRVEQQAMAHAADARRWRAVRDGFMLFDQNGSKWTELVLDGHDPDATADALADQQEASHE